MKKFFSIFMLAMMVMGVSTMLVSCSEDEDGIIGTWRTDYIDEDGDKAFDEFTFAADGSFVWNSGWFDTSDNTWETSTDRGTYVLNEEEGSLILQFTDGGDMQYEYGSIVFLYTLNGKKLTLTYRGESMTLKRK